MNDWCPTCEEETIAGLGGVCNWCGDRTVTYTPGDRCSLCRFPARMLVAGLPACGVCQHVIRRCFEQRDRPTISGGA